MPTDKIVNKAIGSRLAAKKLRPRLGSMGPRRRSAAAARDNILEAAESILRAHGPLELKLASVAAAAGVSTATVLHHFGAIDDFYSRNPVIGVGGLGRLAVQFLRNLCAARVIAVDNSEAHLKLAKEHGADNTLPSDATTAEQVRDAAAHFRQALGIVDGQLPQQVDLLAPAAHRDVIGLQVAGLPRQQVAALRGLRRGDHRLVREP